MRFVLVGFLLASTGLAAAAPPPQPDVAVESRDGLYHVTATFRVSQPAAVVFTVLTDYEHIPRFMPDAALHRELEDYVAAGLTPFEALKTASLNPATLMGVRGDLGTIARDEPRRQSCLTTRSVQRVSTRAGG